MNQIIFYQKDYKKKQKNNYIFFIFIFFISISLIVLFFYHCIKFFYKSHNTYISSNSLSDTIKIQTLYNKNISNNNNFPIIGTIVINKINISYPIFSTTNDELLSLGICKLSGPSINRTGNLCLAGHNYDNNTFFSNISKLSSNDIITIYDSSNISVNYSVYNIFEVNSKDTSILEQTNSNREITLITCNNSNKNRIIVKAKEIE